MKSSRSKDWNLNAGVVVNNSPVANTPFTVKQGYLANVTLFHACQEDEKIFILKLVPAANCSNSEKVWVNALDSKGCRLELSKDSPQMTIGRWGTYLLSRGFTKSGEVLHQHLEGRVELVHGFTQAPIVDSGFV